MAFPPTSDQLSAGAPTIRPEPHVLAARVRWVLAATLAFGVTLHVTAMIVGRAWLLDHVLTPALDLGLTLPMGFAAWGLWRLRHLAEHPYRTHRALYLGLALYMAISVAVHLDTLVAWEVRYVQRFPVWYSAVIIPVQLVMLVFTLRLRFRSGSLARTNGTRQR